VPNVTAEIGEAEAHTRIGWLRSVYNIFQGFAIGSFVDEIANAKGADPRDVWLDIIGPPRKMSLSDLGIERVAQLRPAARTAPGRRGAPP
jgi:isoquinoline 1-oxidoreductase subunit beta